VHIGLNGYFWGRETTGSGQYLMRLLAELAHLCREHRYTLFVPRAATGAKTVDTPPGVRRVEIPFDWAHENLAKLWFEQIAIPRACRRAGVELLHVPYLAPPLFGRLPAVITIHDLIPLVLPAYRGDWRVRLYMRLVARGARRATAILTDSHAARTDIERVLHLPAERVYVIYLAAEERYRPTMDQAAVQAWQRERGLPSDYVLYLGGFDQRRNVQTLIRAFAQFIRQHETAPAALPRLVLAGQLPAADTPFTPDPRRLAREAGIAAWAHFPGRIAEEDKPWLYGGASLFAFPSLYEGFGLPPLEAMACGVPVLAAAATSLPEIVGDGGICLEPLAAEAWANAMARLWFSPEERALWRERAILQAARFSWQRTAAATQDVYQAAYPHRTP